MIPFGELAPDAGKTVPGISLAANNVIPKGIGYGPMRGPTIPTGAEALPGAPRGVFTLIKNDGTWQVFALTVDTLYQLGADYSWTQIATGYACPDGDDWSVAHFGAFLLFTNTVDGLLAYDVEAGSGPASVTAAGKPRSIFVANNQVVALDCEDASGSRNNRLIRVSAFNDHTNWTNRGADYHPLEGGGALIEGHDLRSSTAVVFQEQAISLMTFGDFGGGAYFKLDKLSDGIGASGAKPAVSFDGAAYWLATDGFRRLTSQGVQQIGAGRIDQWFLERAGDLRLVQSAADPFLKIIWFRYPVSGAASDEVFYDLLGYSWQWDRWVTATVTTSALTRIATPGYVLDALDAFGALDDIDMPLGSRALQGGQPFFAALDGDFKLALFTGEHLAATLETSISNNPATGIVQRCTPVCDASDCTVQLGVSDDLSDDLTWKTAASKGRGGRVALRGRGMNVAFRLKIPAASDWADAKGIDHIKGSVGGSA